MSTCPKCQQPVDSNAVECHSCGVILSKARRPSHAPSAPRVAQNTHASGKNVGIDGRQAVRPKLWKLLTRDYLCVLLVMFPLVFSGIAIATGVFGLSIARRGRAVGPEAGSFFAVLALVSVAVAAPLLVLRVRALLGFFQRAVQIEGSIKSVWLSGDKGRVEFSYHYEGSAMESGSAITKNRITKSFEEGQKVLLLVDPDNPKKVKIRGLFV